MNHPNKPDRFLRFKLAVALVEAAPHPLFTEGQRRLVRFIRLYENGKLKSTPCAECGKKKRGLWTMLVSFQAHSMGALVPIKSGKVHPPLTPVCQSHLLAPEYDVIDAKGNVVPKDEQNEKE